MRKLDTCDLIIPWLLCATSGQAAIQGPGVDQRLRAERTERRPSVDGRMDDEV